MKTVKSLLLGSAAGLVAVAGAQAADLPVKAKPVEYVKICTLYGAGFYYVPGTDTCLKLGAYLRFQIESDATGGTTFMNGTPGLYTRTDTPNLNHRVRAVMSWDSRTSTEYGTLRMYFRGGWEQTTPGTPDETVFWDRGFIQFAGFTVGRAESFFDLFSFSPYSYGGTARISGNHTIENRGIMVFGYTAQFGNGFTAGLSIEDGGNAAAGPNGNNGRARGYSVLDLDGAVAGGIGNTVISFANATATLTPDNGSSSAPDIVGNVRVDQAWGSAQLAGALHWNRAGYYSAFGAGCVPGNSTRCENPEQEIGWAVMGSMIVNLPMIAPGDTIGFAATFSEGALGYATRDRIFRLWHHGDSNGSLVSSYGVGFSGDSVFRNPGAIPGYAGQLELTQAFSFSAGAQHFWLPNLRTSLYGGYVKIEHSDVAKALICPAGPGPFVVPVIPVGTSGLAVSNCDPDYSYWAIGSRTQWNPHPYLDIGVDVMWTRLNTAFAGPGVVTAAQGANPAQIVNIEDQDALSVLGRVQYNFLP
jgi:porin-like protein